MELMMPPAEFKKLVQSDESAEVMEGFQKEKAAVLKEVLKSIDTKTASFQGDVAKLQTASGLQVQFEKIEGKWYLRR